MIPDSRTGHLIQMLVYNAHGSNLFMELGGDFTEADITLQELDDLDPEAQIVLLSCNTGNGLAAKMAAIFKRTVYAPLTELVSLNSFITIGPDQEVEISASTPFARFQSDGHTCRIDRSTGDAEYLNELQKYLTRHALSVEAQAQFQLADLLEKTGMLLTRKRNNNTG